MSLIVSEELCKTRRRTIRAQLSMKLLASRAGGLRGGAVQCGLSIVICSISQSSLYIEDSLRTMRLRGFLHIAGGREEKKEELGFSSVCLLCSDYGYVEAEAGDFTYA